MKVFNSEKGFTIIETMVAIAILAVGTLGVASMLMIHFSSDGYAARTRRAESLCLQKVEELKAQKVLVLTRCPAAPLRTSHLLTGGTCRTTNGWTRARTRVCVSLTSLWAGPSAGHARRQHRRAARIDLQ